jgi:hypothetical protein
MIGVHFPLVIYGNQNYTRQWSNSKTTKKNNQLHTKGVKPQEWNTYIYIVFNQMQICKYFIQSDILTFISCLLPPYSSLDSNILKVPSFHAKYRKYFTWKDFPNVL